MEVVFQAKDGVLQWMKWSSPWGWATLRVRQKGGDLMSPARIGNVENNDVVLLTDTTFRGRNFGVVIIKDKISGCVLRHKFIARKGRISDYQEGFGYSECIGKTCLGIVSDNFKRHEIVFKQYRFQYSQIHAMQYV